MTTKLEIFNAALIRCGAEPLVNEDTDQNKRAILLRNQYDITRREILNDTTWNFATDREQVLVRSSSSPSFGYGNAYSIPEGIIRIVEINKCDDFRVEGEKVLTNYEDNSTVVTISRVSTTATVVHVAHGYSDGDEVYIANAAQADYNGNQTITVIDLDSYSYTVSGSTLTPATGTIRASLNTAVLRAKVILDIEDTTLFTASFTKALILKLAEDVSYALVQSNALQQAIISEAERYLRRARSYNSQEGTPQGRYPEAYTQGIRL